MLEFASRRESKLPSACMSALAQRLSAVAVEAGELRRREAREAH